MNLKTLIEEKNKKPSEEERQKTKTDPNKRVSVNFKNRRLNSRWNARAIVFCGGCIKGKIKQNGVVLEHPNCRGTGLRINKRFGRPGNPKRLNCDLSFMPRAPEPE